MTESALQRLKRFDDERPSIPGEHWFALAGGVWFLTRQSGSPLTRAISLAAGAALIVRAASGRDGAIAVLTRKLNGEASGADAAPQDDAPVAVTAADAIDVSNEVALHLWADRFDTTAQQIKDAVAAVGNQAGDVEMHLKGSRSSSNEERVHEAS